MSYSILLSVGLGIISGLFILPKELFNYSDIIIDIGLCLLLFFVGLDIGKNKGVLKGIKKMGLKVLIVPTMVVIGSVFGSYFGGLFFDFPFNESGAIGAGLGWYTLSPMLLADYSTELSALAFISNVIREVLALILIPFIAKYIGYMESIAPAGATAMDTSLPLISKSTDPNTAIVSFITGVILSFLVPILVPIIININI